MACFNTWDIGACGCGGGAPPCVTCGSAAMPMTFAITDINGGPHTATWNGSTGWITPVISSNYYYLILCNSLHKLIIERQWSTPHIGYSGALATVTCGSISWSGTLAIISGLGPDPAAGTTSFTQ